MFANGAAGIRSEPSVGTTFVETMQHALLQCAPDMVALRVRPKDAGCASWCGKPILALQINTFTFGGRPGVRDVPIPGLDHRDVAFPLLCHEPLRPHGRACQHIPHFRFMQEAPVAGRPREAKFICLGAIPWRRYVSRT